MLALISKIPLTAWIKDALFTLALLAIAFLFWHVYREGEDRIEASDTKARAAQVIHNTEVESRVKTQLAAALAAYKAPVPAAPPTPVPVLVCHQDHSGPLPGRGSPVKGSNGAGTSLPVSAEKADAGFDPAPAISADGSAADLEIDHLLAKVNLLQRTIQAYQNGGLVAK